MIIMNNNARMDHEALAMLCGVLPPQYRELPSLGAPMPQGEPALRVVLPDEGDAEPGPALTPNR